MEDDEQIAELGPSPASPPSEEIGAREQASPTFGTWWEEEERGPRSVFRKRSSESRNRVDYVSSYTKGPAPSSFDLRPSPLASAVPR